MSTFTSPVGVQVLPITGGTLTGNLYLNEDPVTSTQAATKNYVDENSTDISKVFAYTLMFGG